MREGRTIKTDKSLIGLTRAKAWGLARIQLTSTKEDQTHLEAQQNNVPRYNILKPPKESHTPLRPRGLHPVGALARTHRKSNDAMTPVHNSLSLCENVHTHTKARGYYRVPKLGVPKTRD
jgi:hypothetical protein